MRSNSLSSRIDVSRLARGQHCLLEFLDTPDARLRGAGLHRDADRDLRQRLDAVGRDVALLGQRLEHRRRDHREIECFAARDALLQRARGVVLHFDLVPGARLEARHQRQHHLLERAAGEHLDGDGLGFRGDDAERGEVENGENAAQHGVELLVVTGVWQAPMIR
jgi:hypothetical protein